MIVSERASAHVCATFVEPKVPAKWEEKLVWSSSLLFIEDVYSRDGRVNVTAETATQIKCIHDSYSELVTICEL